MTCIGLFIGQCGVSLGIKVLEDPPTMFASINGHPHIILIDTENKVVNKAIENYRSCSHFKRFTGCGGCFAKGRSVFDKEKDEIQKLITKELERSDCCIGFVIVHSVCGGTGSGFGSEITKLLKIEYPAMFTINITITPFQSGENPVQSYNFIHTISVLQEYSDMIIYIDNSAVSQICGKNNRNFTMSTINHCIMQNLNILYQKVCNIPSRFTLWETVKSLTPIPATKFVLTGSSFNRNQTTNIETCTRFIKQATCFGKEKSITGITMISGLKYPEMLAKLKIKYIKSFNFVEWNPFPEEFWFCKTSNVGVNVAMNNSAIRNNLSEMYYTAKDKFDAGAYVHWYEKFGTSPSDFEYAFQSLENINENYTYFCS